MAGTPLPQFEDQAIRADNRRLRTLLAVNAGVSLVMLVALFVLILRPRTLPYVIEVNQHGEPVAAAQPVLGAQVLNDVVIKWAIAEFIRNARTVSSDIDEEKDHLRDAYAFASEQAAKALTDYYHDGEHDPFSIAQKSWVEVRINRDPLKLPPPDTYQVDWIETRHAYNSDLSTATNWRATLRVENGAPNTKDGRNPLGLYVTSLDWSPEVH
jgi:type IV secretory pathway TrbF-like protein